LRIAAKTRAAECTERDYDHNCGAVPDRDKQAAIVPAGLGMGGRVERARHNKAGRCA